MTVLPNQASAAVAAEERELKQRVLTCLDKLSDRDTHATAAIELEALGKSLSASTLPCFISCIAATDSSDKSVVRKQCINLISVISFHHGDLLSPYLSKLITAVLRRLRDKESDIRSACISAVSSIATHVTKPSFSNLCKPFMEALFTEQDVNSQAGTATCLSALIKAAAQPDLSLLRKAMVRFEKLIKCESFKAKSAVLVLIGSVIEIGAVAGSKQILGNLVPCLVDFLSSQDWAVRKAAAEALIKFALVENEAATLLDFKAQCLKTFESKKYDKVKAVRETMNRMVEAWKDIPDEASVTSAPQSHSNDTFPSVTDRKITSLTSRDKRTHPTAIFRKPDRNKSSDLKAVNSTGRSRSAVNHEHTMKNKGENENRLTSCWSGVPLPDSHDDKSVYTVSYISNETEYKEGDDDMSMIHQQLLQIGNQQSHLLKLVQKFMGSAESGIHSLETRVNGLEHALDEITFELAMSTGRLSNVHSPSLTCCNLPAGAEFLSPKLWRKTSSGGHLGNSSGNESMQTRANRYTSNPQTLKPLNRRSRIPRCYGS